MSSPAGRFLLDGAALAFEPGDTVAVAAVRAGDHPGRGGTLCLAGDCGSCVAEVEGIAYVRTCLTPATDGLGVARHPREGPPRWHAQPRDREVAVEHGQTDVAVIGGGEAGRAAAAEAEQAGRSVLVLDGGTGDEVVAVYAGPTVIVRRGGRMVHLRAAEVVVATGTAEIQAVGPGSRLAGLLTSRAARQLHAAGVDLGRAVAIGLVPDGVPCEALPGSLVRLEGETRVTAVVTRDEAGEHHAECDTVILDLGRSPRDVLSRMADDLPVRVVGSAAETHPLPRPPIEGLVCPCVGTTVDDLEGVWSAAFASWS